MLNIEKRSETREERLACFRPKLGALLREKAGVPIEQYLTELYAPAPDRVSEAGRTCLTELAGDVLGDVAAGHALRVLSTCPAVTTGPHMSFLTCNNTLQSALLSARGAAAAGLSAVIVMAFGKIPLNNVEYPRGFVWEGKNFPLFPDRQKHALVYGCGRFLEEKLSGLPHGLSTLLRSAPGLFDATLFSTQISRINQTLWTAIKEREPGLPELIFLQAEDLAVSLIIRSLQDSSLLSRLLTEDHLRSEILGELEGTYGCWTGSMGGSHFFYARDVQGREVPCRLNGGLLSSSDYSCPMLPESLSEALQNKRLVPGLFMTYAAFLLNGLRCLGGFNQIDYLSRMHAGLIAALASCGESAAETLTEQADFQGYISGLRPLCEADGTALSLRSCLYGGAPGEIWEKAAGLRFAQANEAGLDFQLSIVEREVKTHAG